MKDNKINVRINLIDKKNCYHLGLNLYCNIEHCKK